ncbi:TetR/AcrR family transcriptional regulator [Patulibacter minatonensis]|uniref:TetR/AcrR family transcriptional regulator n=1 Tax=Patulibacter minatonensis TaxID=298163 RepID=UPI00047C771D|nr:TetR/AcrR family transcriptional regulator [Patulibacter minatonensis]
MARWQPDACGRIQEAAYALYAERGYDATTISDIAERAGLTKRTYFRHFPDKREVLFWGSEALEELFVGGVTDAPPSASPLAAIGIALDAVGEMFAERREFATVRHGIIQATPELQERERIKLARLAESVAVALRGRGVGDPAAILAAEAGMAVFHVAFARWIADADRSLQDLAREALAELRAIASA